VNSVYGPDTVTANHAQFWIRRFRSGNFEAKDEPRSGRPIVKNVDGIMEIVEADRHLSTVSIAQELNISQKTVWNHLNKVGYKKKLHVWVPHELTQKNLMDRISICESLLNRNKIDPFLKRMITGDEKWITYDNIKRKRSWSNGNQLAQTMSKPELTARKVLLCVWWDWQGIIYYELLPYGQTLNSVVYCQQLDRLKAAISQKRPALANRRGVVYHHDNARPHALLVTRQKLRELGWEVLMHPPYSPDLAPSEIPLFLSMANDFAGEKFASREVCENLLLQFFDHKDQGFYERGIMKLLSKWQKVIEQNGACLT
jgi:[histone H3]-lysine36 N-dimethyltransferase SETMAR